MAKESISLNLSQKNDLNQISLTGARAILIIALLLEEPRSMEQIRQAFIDCHIMEPEHSYDMLRVDLNTLRAMGCEITRADTKTGKYSLVGHPFSLCIDEEELKVLTKAYKKIKSTGNVELVLKYDKLFKKLAEYVYGIDIRETIYGLPVSKSIGTAMIEDLIEDCKEKRVLTLIYKAPSSSKTTEKEISAQKVVLKNDKFYLYGYDCKIKKSTVLNIRQILKILSRKDAANRIEVKTTNTRFVLTDYEMIELEDDERIIEKKEDFILVEGSYYNEFIAMQRMLSFGAKCTVLEPENLKLKIVEKLKSMRDIYYE